LHAHRPQICLKILKTTNNYRVIEAGKTAHAVKKPNLLSIARDLDISYTVLHGRVKKGGTSLSGRRPNNMAFTKAQDRALEGWIDLLLLPTTVLIYPMGVSRRA
jgi:hypothetical protein